MISDNYLSKIKLDFYFSLFFFFFSIMNNRFYLLIIIITMTKLDIIQRGKIYTIVVIITFLICITKCTN